MTSKYQHPVADNIFSLLSGVLDLTSREIYTVAGSESSLTPDHLHNIDAFFKSPGLPVSRLSEDINQALALHIHEYLDGLQRLIDTSIVTPGVIAPLALASIKTSSYLKFINEFAGIDRAMWSLRFINEKAASREQFGAFVNLDDTLTHATQTYNQQTAGEPQAIPNDRDLVEQTLEWNPRPGFYDFLTSFTEELPWTGLKHRFYRPQHTHLLELASIEILLETATAAENAARSLAKFRVPEATEDCLKSLDEIRSVIVEIRELWMNWVGKNAPNKSS